MKRAYIRKGVLLVRPGWSSQKVRKPLFISLVRGTKMLAVAVCGAGLLLLIGGGWYTDGSRVVAYGGRIGRGFCSTSPTGTFALAWKIRKPVSFCTPISLKTVASSTGIFGKTRCCTGAQFCK